MTFPADFTAFLIRAKGATYAGGGAEVTPARPAAHDLHYREGDYLYIDTYLGGYKFAGEEAVWHNGAPIWSMNYYGWMLVPEIPPGFSQFLKDALKRAPADAPYRGPAAWQRDGFTYACQWQGALDGFHGEEVIELDGTLIYRLLFHGGMIM